MSGIEMVYAAIRDKIGGTYDLAGQNIEYPDPGYLIQQLGVSNQANAVIVAIPRAIADGYKNQMCIVGKIRKRLDPEKNGVTPEAVSYTHLTLPTIYSV